MECDRCRAYVSHRFKIIYDVDGTEEWVCQPCLWDEQYAKSGGRIPQNPGEQ